MDAKEKLEEIFSNFPGIGPRQARRFVYFLLSRDNHYADRLIEAIKEVKKKVSQCSMCRRFYARDGARGSICSICTDHGRDSSRLCVVSRDVDLEAIEKSGSYDGHYFVLGGTVPILEKEPEKRIRLKELESRIKNDKNLKEIILAMNANQEGENTANVIRERLGNSFSVSTLGRGLSTGAELEYADPETLRYAFLHRGI